MRLPGKCQTGESSESRGCLTDSSATRCGANLRLRTFARPLSSHAWRWQAVERPAFLRRSLRRSRAGLSHPAEKGPQFLSKVRISGGGRCNVTHACFDPREFAAHYPRGERELIAPFQRFQARDTVAWFASRGVKLKTESDGRMFPTTDSSQTIIDCLLGLARSAGVKLHLNRGVEAVDETPGGRFELKLSDGDTLTCDRLLLATGGCRAPVLGQTGGLARSHAGASRAVAVHLPRRYALAGGIGRCFR